MVISQVVGAGIFLAPATMMRTLGSLSGALTVWMAMGVLTATGALCYAELATRYPQAGGGYVFLREAYGRRVAFVYGWMALLVMDPGITAALALGLSQYLLVALALPARWLTPVALGAIVVFALMTLAGMNISTRVMRWTAAAKLGAVLLLVLAGMASAMNTGTAATAPSASGSAAAVASASTPASAVPAVPGVEQIAAAIISAFFAFGGWWELGRMSGEVHDPRRTMPRALLAGVALVTAIYALVSIAFVLVVPGGTSAGDDAFVLMVGAALFGPAAGRLLPVMVVIAIAGSLAAVLLGSPRVYVAMARDGLFPPRLAPFDEERGTSPGGTLIQASIAIVLVLLGTFNEILGYFVPAAVFFLGLSAAAILVLPRPAMDAPVFRSPWHPLPVAMFLTFIVVILGLFAMGQPMQTLIGAGVVALGVPVSYLVLRPARAR
jgi:APA family basic amino acid/polyamine antiporter